MSSEIIPVPPLPQVPERYDPQHMRNFQRQVTDFMHSASRPGVGLDGRLTTIEAAAPYRRVGLSSNVSLAPSTSTNLVFATSLATSGAAPAFDSTTGIITLDAGLWLLRAQVNFSMNAGDDAAVQARLTRADNSVVGSAGIAHTSAVARNGIFLQASSLRVEPGVGFKVRVFQNSGGTRTVLATNTFFEVARIGP